MNDFIYNQHDIPKEQYRYGLRASADVGCGWVATWNALQILGYKTDIPALIRYYEWQLPLIHGNTGTSFWGPAVCFRKWGFPVKIVVDTKRFDEAAKNADACILFYHWRNKYRFGAHFVALRTTAGLEEGEFARRFGKTIGQMFGPALEKNLAAGRLKLDGGRLALTQTGMDFMNGVLCDFLP